MMSSVDGRIDCAMTEKLPGVEEYYSTLGELNAATTLSGKPRQNSNLPKAANLSLLRQKNCAKRHFQRRPTHADMR